MTTFENVIDTRDNNRKIRKKAAKLKAKISQKEIEDYLSNEGKDHIVWLTKQKFLSDNLYANFFRKIVGDMTEHFLVKGWKDIFSFCNEKSDNKVLGRYVDVKMDRDRFGEHYIELKTKNIKRLHFLDIEDYNKNFYRPISIRNVAKVSSFLEKSPQYKDKYAYGLVNISLGHVLEVLMGRNLDYKNEYDIQSVYKKIRSLMGAKVIEDYFDWQSNLSNLNSNNKEQGKQAYNKETMMNDIKQTLKAYNKLNRNKPQTKFFKILYYLDFKLLTFEGLMGSEDINKYIKWKHPKDNDSNNQYQSSKNFMYNLNYIYNNNNVRVTEKDLEMFEKISKEEFKNLWINTYSGSEKALEEYGLV